MRTLIRRSIKVVSITLVVLVLLLGGLYGLLYTDWFVRKALLPLVARQTGLALAVEGVELSPPTSIILHGFRIGPQDDPFITAKKLEVHYDLRQLIHRHIVLTTLNAEDYQVRLKLGKRGDVALPGFPAKSPQPKKETPSNDEPIPLDLTHLSLKRGTVRVEGNGRLYELRDLHLNAESLQFPGKILGDLAGTLTLNQNPYQIEALPVALKLDGKSRKNFSLSSLRSTLSFGTAPEFFRLVSDAKWKKAGIDLTIKDFFSTKQLLTLLNKAPPQLTQAVVKGTARYTQREDKTAVVKADLTFPELEWTARPNKSTSLNDSLLHAEATLTQQGIDASALDLQINGPERMLFDASLRGTLPYALHEEMIRLEGVGAVLHLKDLINVVAPPRDPLPVGTVVHPAETSQVSQPLTTAPSIIPVANASCSLRLQSVSYGSAVVEEVELNAKLTKKILELQEFRGRIADGGINLSGRIDLNDTASMPFTTELNGSNFSLPKLLAHAEYRNQLDSGTLQNVNLELRGVLGNPENFKKSLTGNFSSRIDDVVIPSTLQGQPPFNLLFLPFRAVLDVIGGISNLVLPEALLSSSSKIRGALDKSGRLGIRKGVIELVVANGKVDLEEVDLTTRNLPDISFHGDIGLDGTLSLTTFVSLLKLNLPIPISGTVQSPSASVIRFVPNLIRGIGLSMTSVVGDFGSLLGLGGKEKKLSKVEKYVPKILGGERVGEKVGKGKGKGT